MAASSTTSLVDALRQYKLLEPSQMEEVAHNIQTRFPNPKALAGELIQRGWLTPYQANQLLQGRGQELVLGSYILLERVGEGGMGQVFKAKNWKFGRMVALKLIRKERLDNPDAVRRFEREVRSAAALDHPNIVHAHDADQVGGTHLLVMEYVEGIDLAKLVKKNGPLPVQQACEYIRQTALGLQHAHERGMVHRDIKPANLLLTADGKLVKILDMGLARLDQPTHDDDKSSTMTQEGAVMGTPDYIAPEQALESHTVDIRADLYSLGCTLYYLLIGKVPFPGGSLTDKLLKHQLHEPRPVEQMRPDVPSGVAAVVRKLMAKKPEDRYQTPAEVAAALAAVFSIGRADDRTVVTVGRPAAVAEASGDTFASPFASLRTDPADSAQRQQRKALEGRLLRYGVGAGSLILVGIVVLLSFVLKQPVVKKLGVNEENRPVVDVTPAKKTPAQVDDAWLKEVAAMPAEKQAEAVAAKLKELNTGFDGKVTRRIEGGVVTSLAFLSDNMTDISPLRGLAGLKSLGCRGANWINPGKLADLTSLKCMKLTYLNFGITQVSDLTPLKGMPLTDLDFSGTQVADLSPLKDMKLKELACNDTKVANLSPLKGMPLIFMYCGSTQVSDLSPLRGMPLTVLHCGVTQVSDLSPLRGMPLMRLLCHNTQVSDLSPLKGMPLIDLNCDNTKISNLLPLKDLKLTSLRCAGTQVSDLSPLKGMPLTVLTCNVTQVFDLSPLKGMPLKSLVCDFKPERDTEILRSIKTLETINGKPAAEFWKEVDNK